jgi:hypothetical protein
MPKTKTTSKQTKKTSNKKSLLRLRHLFSAIIVAVSIIGVFLFVTKNTPISNAADTGPTSIILEAENLVWSPTSAPTIYSDGAASGGKAVKLTATATGSAAGPTSALQTVQVTARGDQCGGAPTMQVKLDGSVIGNQTVTASAWTQYNFPVNVPAGTHRLDISYTNPYSQWFLFWNTCNRALYIDKANVYSASSTPTTLPTGSKYVSLGDSYSSGLGSEKTPTTASNTAVFDQSTIVWNNSCARSSISAARQLASARAYTLTDASCAGATIPNILTSGQYGEPAQITRVTSDTNLVTLTIGGNDLGLLGFIACAQNGECTSSSSTTQTIQSRLASFQSQISSVLSAIKSKAPNAQIRIAGYPYILALPGSTSGSCSFLSANELVLFNSLMTQSNNLIKQAAVSSGGNVKYVDPMASDSPFMQLDNGLNRSACSTSSARLFNGPLDSTPGAWHPNAGGFSAYYTLYNSSL